MARRLIIYIYLIYAVLFASVAVLAGDGNDARSRGLYESKKADGMEFQALQIRNGKVSAVDPGQVFKQGDEIKFRFSLNFDCYVYVVNVTPSGSIKILYPNTSGQEMLSAGREYDAPRGLDGFKFDGEKGTEIIQVYMSRTPLAKLEYAIRYTNNTLESPELTNSNVVASRSVSVGRAKGGVNTNVSTLPKFEDDGLASRTVTLSPGKSSQKKNVVTVAPSEPPQAVPVSMRTEPSINRLRNQEVAVFEVRLNHQ